MYFQFNSDMNGLVSKKRNEQLCLYFLPVYIELTFIATEI